MIGYAPCCTYIIPHFFSYVNYTIWLQILQFGYFLLIFLFFIGFFRKNEKSLYFLIHECTKILRLFQKFTPESADYAEHEKFS